MIKFSFITVVGIAYVVAMVTLTIPSIGKEYSGVYGTALPFEMLIVIGIAFVLGYIGSRCDLE